MSLLVASICQGWTRKHPDQSKKDKVVISVLMTFQVDDKASIWSSITYFI